jgi:hypothetical protein
MLEDLETGIERLRAEYQKYFLGVERQAPAKLHTTVQRQLRDLETTRPRATALKFRLGGLRSRYVTYNHYWTRILNQIENGTFRRDRLRAQRRMAELEPEPEPEPAAAPARPTEPTAAVPTIPPPPTTGSNGTKPSPPPPAPSGVPGMDGPAVRRLYADLVAAKRAAGEKTDGLTYKALVRKLAREAPRLQEQHGAPVKFEVARIGGKVTLRARTEQN